MAAPTVSPVHKKALLLTILLIIVVWSPGRTQTIPPQAANGPVDIRWEGGLLSVDLAGEIPAKRVIEEIGEKVGFKVLFIGEPEQHIQVSFQRLSLERGLRKIMEMADLDFITVYARITDGPGEKTTIRLKKLIIIAKGKGGSKTTYTRSLHLVRPAGKSSSTIALKRSPSGSHRASPGLFEGSKEDLDNYLTDLVEQGRLSRREYEQILESISGRTRGRR